MIITVTSYKGGVGKTTTAIHLAAYLQTLAPTLLVDGDAIRSATKWSQRSEGKGLPFKVISHAQMVNHIRDYTHIIIDTEGADWMVVRQLDLEHYRPRLVYLEYVHLSPYEQIACANHFRNHGYRIYLDKNADNFMGVCAAA